MLDKVKITITREDGSPICPLAQEPITVFLTDDIPFLVIRKDGGTVESVTVDATAGMGLELCRDLVGYLYANLCPEDRAFVFAKAADMGTRKPEEVSHE